MVNYLVVVVVTLVGTLFGMGVAYLLFLYTRPKKMTWKANVYQVGEGVRPATVKGGRVISDLKLNDLKPYTKDVIEKVYKKNAQIVYKLVRLNKVVDGVPSDAVSYWGDKDKEVDVLYEGETCTVMKRGYDKASGVIFQPLSHDKINLIKGEIAIRKDRLDDTKDILQSITPWIVTGMMVFGLIFISYLLINGFTEISENLEDGMNSMAIEIKNANGGNIIPQPLPDPGPTAASIAPPTIPG